MEGFKAVEKEAGMGGQKRPECSISVFYFYHTVLFIVIGAPQCKQ